MHVVTFNKSNQLWKVVSFYYVYNKAFGRVNILSFGDLSQLKPIGSLWRCEIADLGIICWLLGRLVGSLVGWLVGWLLVDW